MQMPDKVILEALAGSRILPAMITPAVLISACGTLIFSTSGRLGRVFDRVNAMKSELEGVRTGTIDLVEERTEYISTQLKLQRIRASLIQKALAALYTATLFFISSSLAIALNMAYGSSSTAWIQTLLALSGSFFLLIASGLLLYESRYNLQFINHHLKFIGALLETPSKSSQ